MEIIIGILIAAFCILLALWVAGVMYKLADLEARLDKQNEINQHFKLEKKYKRRNND